MITKQHGPGLGCGGLPGLEDVRVLQQLEGGEDGAGGHGRVVLLLGDGRLLQATQNHQLQLRRRQTRQTCKQRRGGRGVGGVGGVCYNLRFFFFFFFFTLSLSGYFGSPYLGKTTATAVCLFIEGL